MIRSTLIAAAMLALAGCGRSADPPVTNDATANEAMYDNMTADVSPDDLSAPSDMPLDTESNSIGSASGGNAM